MGGYNEASRLEGSILMKLTYAIIMQEGPNNWNGWSPDVAGCSSAGDSRDDQRRQIKDALEGHLMEWEKTRAPFPWPKCTTPEEALAAEAAIAAELAAEWPDDPTDEEEGWSPPIAEMIEIEVDIPAEITIPESVLSTARASV